MKSRNNKNGDLKVDMMVLFICVDIDLDRPFRDLLSECGDQGLDVNMDLIRSLCISSNV